MARCVSDVRITVRIQRLTPVGSRFHAMCTNGGDRDGFGIDSNPDPTAHAIDQDRIRLLQRPDLGIELENLLRVLSHKIGHRLAAVDILQTTCHIRYGTVRKVQLRHQRHFRRTININGPATQMFR
jgi:hypothetical protein